MRTSPTPLPQGGSPLSLDLMLWPPPHTLNDSAFVHGPVTQSPGPQPLLGSEREATLPPKPCAYRIHPLWSEEEFGCILTQENLLNHFAQNKRALSTTWIRELLTALIVEVCSHFWPVKLHKYWGVAWLEPLFMGIVGIIRSAWLGHCIK